MNMSEFNKGDLFTIDAYDASCLGCAIGHNIAKFRFCLGEMHHLRNEKLRRLFSEEQNYIILDLYLYGINSLKTKYFSALCVRYSDVATFDEIDGDLVIQLIEDDTGLIEFRMRYDSYKWDFVKEYTPDDLTIEEEDKLAKNLIASSEEYEEIVWKD